MVYKFAGEGRNLAFKIFFYQSLIVTCMSITLLIFFKNFTVLSFFYGGLTNVIINGVFAFFAFKHSGARQTKLMVQSFSRGTKLKLYITVLMTVIAFAGLNLEPFPLFVGFMVSNFCQWAVMIKTSS